jgi:hypothetical protein
MAHEHGCKDSQLQELYSNLMDCQRTLQQLAQVLKGFADLNVFMARELDGRPGCERLVSAPSECCMRSMMHCHRQLFHFSL